MFEIEKSFRFEAGHQLEYHDGMCREPHGHSYQFFVTLKSEKLITSGPKKNMIIDFIELGEIVKPMIEKYLDHKWLNDSLNSDSPTAEFIAKWIFDHLSPQLKDLYSITLFETETSKVIYRRTG
jgi:6-pyruvoyltetrahydropterin/6-carboxytetrahydropterin synthase